MGEVHVAVKRTWVVASVDGLVHQARSCRWISPLGFPGVLLDVLVVGVVCKLRVVPDIVCRDGLWVARQHDVRIVGRSDLLLVEVGLDLCVRWKIGQDALEIRSRFRIDLEH